MKGRGIHKLVAPFLIAKDAEAQFRVTVLGTRFNSSNYPIASSKLQPEIFKSAMAACVWQAGIRHPGWPVPV
jgi:hypothetical protein